MRSCLTFSLALLAAVHTSCHPAFKQFVLVPVPISLADTDLSKLGPVRYPGASTNNKKNTIYNSGVTWPSINLKAPIFTGFFQADGEDTKVLYSRNTVARLFMRQTLNRGDGAPGWELRAGSIQFEIPGNYWLGVKWDVVKHPQNKTIEILKYGNDAKFMICGNEHADHALVQSAASDSPKCRPVHMQIIWTNVLNDNLNLTLEDLIKNAETDNINHGGEALSDIAILSST